MGHDPSGGVLVFSEEDVGRHDRLFDFGVKGIADRRSHPGAGGHCQEGCVDPFALRQPEADVRGPTRCVDTEFIVQTPEKRKDLLAGRPYRSDGHDERIDHDVLFGDAVVGGPVNDLPGYFVSNVWIF